MKSIIELYLHSKTAINLIVNILKEVEYKKGEKLVTLEKKTYDMFFIKNALELPIEYKFSKTYEENKPNDFRDLADSKKKVEISFLSYIQMFDQKFGFLKNLSILDLLFMEGPNSINFLVK